MHDVHCHLDLYEDPLVVANAAERAYIFTIAVTNLPSACCDAAPHMRRFRHLKLAVGFHPLLTEHHTAEERQLFREALTQTQYVGEVGLDFSRKGAATREDQIESFRFVLDLLRHQDKLVTVHSRRAESSVLDMITEFDIGPVIFHWYSGSLTVLDRIAQQGHYFSVNPAMLRSANGERVVERIPQTRLLTETDGPFVTVARRPAVPLDVRLVHEYLATHWRLPKEDVVEQLESNLRECISSATGTSKR
jgi:TatD DNase family protein